LWSMNRDKWQRHLPSAHFHHFILRYRAMFRGCSAPTFRPDAGGA
jgi:hypothetical protein